MARLAEDDRRLASGVPSPTAGAGRPLPDDVRLRFEAALGHDLQHVRVHTDAAAARSAAALAAHAATDGEHIWFSQGAWAPGTPRGDQLLAHELTHVVQAIEGRLPTGGGVTQPSDPVEREAYAAEVAVAAAARAVDPTPSVGSGGDGPVLDQAVMGQPAVEPAHQQAPHAVGPVARDVDEAAMGVPVREQAIEGVTQGYFNLRLRPTTDAPVVGQLSGTTTEVVVTGKAVHGDIVWYKVQLADPSVLMTPSIGAGDESAEQQAEVGGHRDRGEGWVVADALTLRVSYAQFLVQLRAFEASQQGVGVKERITALRQMAHPESLPFDSVIGAPAGGLYEDGRSDLAAFYQLLKGPKAIELPSGEVVDIYHFLVGLDALQPERMEEHQTVWGMSVGASYAAATWAGDIGAGVADHVRGQDTAWEAYNGSSSQSERRRHYFDTRAPHADLIADIDAWGAASSLPGAASVEGVITGYYGAVDGSDGGDVLRENRRIALARFLSHYGFSSPTGLEGQPAVAQFQHEIFQFAKMWMRNRSLLPLLGPEQTESLWAESGQMATLLAQWLQGQAASYGVSQAELTVGGNPLPPSTPPQGEEAGAPAGEAFDSSFDLSTRLPKSRDFQVGSQGVVQVTCAGSRFTRPDREGLETDRYAVILRRGNAFRSHVAEVLFQVGKDGRATWNGLEPGVYCLELVLTTAPRVPYERLEGDIAVRTR
jgi:hypothetical protein